MSGHRAAAKIPTFTSMPEHFKNNGFLTLGVGKLCELSLVLTLSLSHTHTHSLSIDRYLSTSQSLISLDLDLDLSFVPTPNSRVVLGGVVF